MSHDRHLWWGRTRIFDEIGQKRRGAIGVAILGSAFSLALYFVGDWSVQLMLGLLWFGLPWLHWLRRLQALFRPVNMLVPNLQRRLLRMTMEIWLIGTILAAGAATVRHGLADFFWIWADIAALALMSVIWRCRALRWRVLGLTLLVAASSLIWWKIVVLPVWLASAAGWLVFGLLAGLAWSSFTIALAIDAAQAQGRRRNLSLPNRVHQMRVQRMIKAALKPQQAGQASRPVPLATILNAGYGWKFHWSAILFDWSFWLALFFAFCSWLDYTIWRGNIVWGLAMTMIMVGRFIFRHISSLYFNPVQKVVRFGSLREKWDVIYSTRWDDTPGMVQGLLLLAPGMSRGKALNQAIVAIGLRYFCVVWLVSMAICALILAPLPWLVQVYMLVLVGSAQAFMACLFLHDYARQGVIWEFFPNEKFKKLRLLLNNLPWVLWFISLPGWGGLHDWDLLGNFLPWWVGICFVSGLVISIYRWRSLADAPSALPAGRRQP